MQPVTASRPQTEACSATRRSDSSRFEAAIRGVVALPLDESALGTEATPPRTRTHAAAASRETARSREFAPSIEDQPSLPGHAVEPRPSSLSRDSAVAPAGTTSCPHRSIDLSRRMRPSRAAAAAAAAAAATTTTTTHPSWPRRLRVWDALYATGSRLGHPPGYSVAVSWPPTHELTRAAARTPREAFAWMLREGQGRRVLWLLLSAEVGVE